MRATAFATWKRERHNSKRRMSMGTGQKVLYLVAGTGIGAALGILFAPSSGEELRNTLSTQTHRGIDLVTGKVEQGTGTVRNIVDRGKQAINESVEGVKTRFNESLEAGK